MPDTIPPPGSAAAFLLQHTTAPGQQGGHLRIPPPETSIVDSHAARITDLENQVKELTALVKAP